MSSAQRFLPLEQIGGAAAAAASHSNVVQLRPAVAMNHTAVGQPTRPAVRQLDESVLHQAWEGTDRQRMVAPASKSQARERRRMVLLSLTGLAVVTLLIALMAPSTIFISMHIVADLLLVGFAILLVRHRQMASEQSARVAPIRPAVTVSAPAPVQLAPSYLVSNG